MTKTRGAPVCIRLGSDRETRVNTLMERDGLNRSQALHRLIDQGLEAEGIAPKAKVTRDWSIA